MGTPVFVQRKIVPAARESKIRPLGEGFDMQSGLKPFPQERPSIGAGMIDIFVA